MSPSAVTERVGLGIGALVRLRYPSGNYRPFRTLLDTTPEIIEAHYVTGEDCFVLRSWPDARAQRRTPPPARGTLR
jgi:DNA-binding Lrp family transcriptional regulator